MGRDENARLRDRVRSEQDNEYLLRRFACVVDVKETSANKGTRAGSKSTTRTTRVPPRHKDTVLPKRTGPDARRTHVLTGHRPQRHNAHVATAAQSLSTGSTYPHSPACARVAEPIEGHKGIGPQRCWERRRMHCACSYSGKWQSGGSGRNSRRTAGLQHELRR